MEQNRLKELIFGKDYYSIEDLRYNQKIGILLSKTELTELFDDCLLYTSDAADD